MNENIKIVLLKGPWIIIGYIDLNGHDECDKFFATDCYIYMPDQLKFNNHIELLLESCASFAEIGPDPKLNKINKVSKIEFEKEKIISIISCDMEKWKDF